MNSKELIKALDTLVEEKNISPDVVFEALQLALQTAYKKNFNSKTNVRVDINRDTGEIKVYSYLVVVDEYDEGHDEEDGSDRLGQKRQRQEKEDAETPAGVHAGHGRRHVSGGAA